MEVSWLSLVKAGCYVGAVVCSAELTIYWDNKHYGDSAKPVNQPVSSQEKNGDETGEKKVKSLQTLQRQKRNKSFFTRLSTTEIYGFIGGVSILLISLLFFLSLNDALEGNLFLIIGVPPSAASPSNLRKLSRALESSHDFESNAFAYKKSILKFLRRQKNLHLYDVFNINVNFSPSQSQLIIDEAEIERQPLFCCGKILKELLVNIFVFYIVCSSKKSLKGLFFYAVLLASSVAAGEVACKLFGWININAWINFLWLNQSFQSFGLMQLQNLVFLTTYGKIKLLKDVMVPVVFSGMVFYQEASFQSKEELAQFFSNVAIEQQKDLNLLLSFVTKALDALNSANEEDDLNAVSEADGKNKPTNPEAAVKKSKSTEK